MSGGSQTSDRQGQAPGYPQYGQGGLSESPGIQLGVISESKLRRHREGSLSCASKQKGLVSMN